MPLDEADERFTIFILIVPIADPERLGFRITPDTKPELAG
jgi:hypothetical protein